MNGLTASTVSPIPLAAALVGMSVVAWTVLGAVRRGYRRTLGRRRELAARLAKLACGVTTEHLESLLGPATFRRAIGEALIERVHVLSSVHVQTVADAEGSVVRYAVTVTDRRFHPTFLLGVAGNTPGANRVRLGHTRFGDITHRPVGVAVNLGARRVGYQEEYYFGNPGFYQTFHLAINDAGYLATSSLDWPAVHNEQMRRTDRLPAEAGDPFLLLPATQAFRHSAVVNTFAVTTAHLSDSPLAQIALGPDLDQVRLLSGHQPRIGARDQLATLFRHYRN